MHGSDVLRISGRQGKDIVHCGYGVGIVWWLAESLEFRDRKLIFFKFRDRKWILGMGFGGVCSLKFRI